MSFQLIHPDEPLLVENIVALLFGDAGSGKSSIAFTAENPLCLDFDKGLQRVVNRGMTARFKDWNEALDFIESDTIPKNGIKSLIIDTAGTMLDDYIAGHILKMDVKGVDNGAGGLGLRGYGVMKDITAKFFLRCRQHGVDVIFVCHGKKEDDGDAKKYYPAMTGGSYDIVVSKADLIGYMAMVGSQITLDFNPTGQHTGKNCTGFPKLNVPHFSDPAYGTFFAKIIADTKAHMRRQNEKQAEAIRLVDNFKLAIDTIETIAELDTKVGEIEKLSPAYKAQVNQFYVKKYAELWSVDNVDVKMSKPEDFRSLAAKIKTLPELVRPELYDIFRNLLSKANLVYVKDGDKYVPKADAPAPTAAAAPTQTPPVDQTKPAETVAQEPAKTPPPAAEPTKEKKEKAPAKPKATKAKEPEKPKVIRSDAWFAERLGKRVLQRADGNITECLIEDDIRADHISMVLQGKRGFEYFDLNEDPNNPTLATIPEGAPEMAIAK